MQQVPDPAKMTRSQRLLLANRTGGMVPPRSKVNVRDGSSNAAHQSLPPPFPPIRLRGSEQESIFRTTAPRDGSLPPPDFPANNNSINTKPINTNNTVDCVWGPEYEFGTDYLLRDYPLAAEWLSRDADCQRERSASETQGPMRSMYLEGAAGLALSMEAAVIESMGGNDSLYTVATDKGIVVPYTWYGRVADALFERIDRVYALGQERNARSEKAGRVDTVGEPAWDEVGHTDAAQRSRVAIATAILWRMLTQVQSVVPGMGTALSLFEEFILPSVYENIDAVVAEVPQLTSLSDQIRLFGDDGIAKMATAELYATRRTNMVLERRNEYLRKAIENWGFQIWRGATNAAKRRDIALERLGRLVQRAPNDRLKRTVFSAWRLHTRDEKVTRVGARYKAGYQAFLDGSPNEGMTQANVKDMAAAVLSPQKVPQQECPAAEDAHSLRVFSPITPARPTKPPSTPNGGRRGTNAGYSQLDPGSESLVTNDPSLTVDATCDVMLSKIRQLDAIGVALRGQNAHQVNTINKLDRQLKEATERIDGLTSQLLDLNNQKLALVNLLHEKELEAVEMERTHRRLVSKNHLQLHGPWRQSGLRHLAEICGIVLPPSQEERISEKYLCRDMIVAEELGESSDVGMLPTKEEVAFGRLAPLVVSQPCQLPDPMLILLDWTNNCLDQLHDLDGLGDAGPYAARLSDVADLSVGTVLPRLLFYLSLPLYRPNTEMKYPTEDCAANRLRLLTGYDCCVAPPGPSFSSSFGDIVRMPTAVRLAALIDFASDLVSGRSRAEAHGTSSPAAQSLLAPAGAGSGELDDRISRGSVESELTPSAFAAHVYIRSRAYPGQTVPAATNGAGNADAVIASLPDLRDVASPLLLAHGCRHSSVNLLSILYLRFAHTFNHKAIVQQVEEEQIIKGLAEEALESRQQMEQVMSDHRRACVAGIEGGSASSAPTPHSPYRDILQAFATEEKTPWQLYFERCRPMVCSGANGFVAKGHFWDPSSIESSEAFDVFGRMMLAMRTSLEHHRWHIISSCLLSGPSGALASGKSIFHGPLGSPIAFLRQEAAMYRRQVDGSPRALADGSGGTSGSSRWESSPRVPQRPLLERRSLHAIALYRGDVTLGSYLPNPYNPCSALLGPRDARVLSLFVDDVLRFLQRYADEWCDLFLSRCTAMALQPQNGNGTLDVQSSSSCTSVVWTLPTWRIFWRELGVSLDLVDEELLTDLFQVSGAALRVEEQYSPFNVATLQGDDDEEAGVATVPIELLPTFNWHLYAAVAMRTGYVPAEDEEDGLSFMALSGYSLPLVLGDAEASLRATQELTFHEWLEAVVRVVSIIVARRPPQYPSAVSMTAAGDAFTEEVYSITANHLNGGRRGDVVVPFLKALEWFTFSKVIGPFASSGASSPIPRQRLRHLVQGVYVEEVLRFHHSALLVIFEYYGKFRGSALRDQLTNSANGASSVHGKAAYAVTIEFSDWYAMLKESGAMGSGEINQGGLMELFLAVSVEMRSHVYSPSNSKTLQPRPPYPIGDPRRLTPAAAAASTAAISKTTLLPFAHFGLSLAILAQIKYPNPLRPFHARFHAFLLKCIETPLRAKVPSLNSVLLQRRGQDPSILGNEGVV